MNYFVIDIAEQLGRILSGAGDGRRGRNTLLGIIEDEQVRGIALVVLDFANVEVATASFLREAIFGLKAHLRTLVTDLYPVLANLPSSLVDEIELLSGLLSSPCLMCRIKEGRISDVDLVGNLDPKQEMTFKAVMELGRTDASELMKRYGDVEGTTRTTAWNNRLSALSKKGLIVASTRGRAKTYTAIFEGAV